MEVQERFFDVDEFWSFACQPENANKRFELIHGELVEMPQPGEEHGFIAGEIAFRIRLFDSDRKLGILTVDAGYYSQEDRSTVLGPDVAFRRADASAPPLQKKWAPTMPDLAVEIKSPSNSLAELRQKAAIYLRRETQLVWIVIPDRKGVEVCRLGVDGDIEREFIGEDGALSGEPVLPGFTLEPSSLFS
jgi:Uma2 family endonuclease